MRAVRLDRLPELAERRLGVLVYFGNRGRRHAGIVGTASRAIVQGLLWVTAANASHAGFADPSSLKSPQCPTQIGPGVSLSEYQITPGDPESVTLSGGELERLRHIVGLTGRAHDQSRRDAARSPAHLRDPDRHVRVTEALGDPALVGDAGERDLRGARIGMNRDGVELAATAGVVELRRGSGSWRYRRSGVGNSPPSRIWARGSASLTAERNARSRVMYCAAFGSGFQKSGEFGSFQTCQSVIGSSGRSGCVRPEGATRSIALRRRSGEGPEPRQRRAQGRRLGGRLRPCRRAVDGRQHAHAVLALHSRPPGRSGSSRTGRSGRTGPCPRRG